jgi:hypothetical protein
MMIGMRKRSEAPAAVAGRLEAVIASTRSLRASFSALTDEVGRGHTTPTPDPDPCDQSTRPAHDMSSSEFAPDLHLQRAQPADEPALPGRAEDLHSLCAS